MIRNVYQNVYVFRGTSRNYFQTIHQATKAQHNIFYGHMYHGKHTLSLLTFQMNELLR